MPCKCEQLAVLINVSWLVQGRRALQFCGGDVDRAAEFALQQRQQAEVGLLAASIAHLRTPLRCKYLILCLSPLAFLMTMAACGARLSHIRA